MAKVVGFTIEIKGQKELVDTTKILGLLNTQLILINNTLKEIDKNAGKGLNKLGKDFKKTADSAKKLGDMTRASFDTFEKGNKVVQDLGNGYFEVTRQVEKAGKEFRELDKVLESDSDSIKDLIARNKELKKTLEAAPIGEQTDELQKLKIEYSENAKEIKDFRKELKNASKDSKIQTGSIDDLKKRAKELKTEYNALTASQKRGPFSEGAKIAKSINRINKALDRQNKAIRRSSRLGKTLTKTFTRLFIGRSIIEGAVNGLRNMTNGLQNIIEESDGANEAFNKITDSGNRLTATAKGIGTTFLESFGGGIAKIIDNVAFSFSVVSESILSAAEGSGFLGTALRAVGSIFTDFPAIIGGVIAVFGEFRDRAVNSVTELSLQLEKAFVNVKRLGTALTGGDTAAIDARLQQINEGLERNVVFARTIGEAYNQGFNDTIAAQEEFNKNADEQFEQQEALAKQQERNAAARKKADADEKKRQEQLSADRTKIIEEFRSESESRIQIIKELGAELTAAEIENVQDATNQAIQAENERFRLEEENRKNNFEQRKLEAKRQREELERLFEEGSAERIEFEKDTASQLQQIRDVNNQIAEQKAKEHQQNLIDIRKEGAIELIQIQTIDVFAEEEKARDEFFKNDLIARQQQFERQRQLEESAAENRKENLQKALDTTQAISDTAFSAIAQFTEFANEQETSRLDSAIANRETSINNLNEQLQNATGLQRQFLEQQVKQEKKALEEEQKQREEAEKKRVKDAQTVALIQAIINGALAITRAFSDLGPIAGAVAAVGVAAGIAVQIATIASQKFEDGGILSGPSHANGGIPIAVGGSMVEAEGGEAIMNKRSTAMFTPLLSAINVAGGGKKFQTGGIIGAPISAPTASNRTDSFIEGFNQRTQALEGMIMNIEVTQDLNNLEDIRKNDVNLNVLSTLS